MDDISDADENRLRCPAQTRTGAPCRGHPLAATGLCVAHTAGSDHWRALGGHATSRAERAERLLPSKLRPVAEALERALHRVETDELYTRQATAMATVAVALMRVVTAGELEERLRALEQHAHDEKLFRDARGRPLGRKDGLLPWDKIISD